jgi:hypothetical protein
MLRIMGVLLFTPLSFLWQLLNQFLLSPWGLVVPMTLLIALFAVQQVQKTPVQLAQFYAEQLETCDDTDLSRLLKILVQMEDAGVRGLVKGLTSNRESVFTACRNVLQHEFDRWQESEQREHHFLVFSEVLLEMCHQFSPAAQAEAMQFVDQIVQIRSPNAATPESVANRQKTIAHCERLLSQLESVRRRRSDPKHKDFDSTTPTITSLDRRTQQPVLLTSNGQPLIPASAPQEKDETHLADTGSFNPFSVPRADRLMAYQRAHPNRFAEDRNNSRLSHDRETPEMAHFPPPQGLTAEMEQKLAQHFLAGNDSEPPRNSDISEEYRSQKLIESGGTFRSDNFLSPELQNIPLDRIPHLSTTQLMQLLHHPESAHVESARKTLISRDGFQESHMKLAWRLYHPVAAVREEIVAMLPHTTNVHSSDWLKVLLNDPSNDVRYRTASFLVTTNDQTLQRLLIDLGKRDTDVRIVNLADRLNDSQGTPRRY